MHLIRNHSSHLKTLVLGPFVVGTIKERITEALVDDTDTWVSHLDTYMFVNGVVLQMFKFIECTNNFSDDVEHHLGFFINKL